jgi:hypothetical protein
MIGLFQQNDDPRRKTYQVLASRILGVSPLLAKEVIFRSGADVGQKAIDAEPDSLLESLREMIEPLLRRDWQPGIVVTEQGVEAFSVYPLASMAGWRRTESPSEAIVAFYGAPVGPEAYEAARKPVRDMLQEAQAKLRARLASLERSMTDDAERELLRQSGELILAYQYALQKADRAGAQYETDAPDLAIRLDLQLTPSKTRRLISADTIRLNGRRRRQADSETRGNWTPTQLVTNPPACWPEIDEGGGASGWGYGRVPARNGRSRRRQVGREGRLRHQDATAARTTSTPKNAAQRTYGCTRDVPGAHVVRLMAMHPDAVIEQRSLLPITAIAREQSAGRCTRRPYRRSGYGPGIVTHRNEEPVWRPRRRG